VRTVAWWRLELGLLAGLALAGWWLAGAVTPALGVAAPAAAVVTVLAVPRLRVMLRGALSRARARRRWCRGCRAAALPTLKDRPAPGVIRARPVPAGDLLELRVPFGTAVADLEAGKDVLAAALHARTVRVTRDPVNARHARVLVVRRDPLGDGRERVWPRADAARVSLWEPIPLAVGEDGETVSVSLPERNLLLGGEPGAGKSAALSLLVASAALDPTVVLWLFDGKLVELASWNRVAHYSVGPDLAEANRVLAALQTEMDARYQLLLAHRARKVTPELGLPLHVVVCDELAFYLHTGERKARVEFAELTRDLVARGRAAGIIVLAATQKPSVDIVPSALRDLFGFRWALRCCTPQASDTILGQGWAAQDYSAADVDAAHRGVGYLLHEGGAPVRCKAFYLDDAALDRLARQAEELRGVTPSAPSAVRPPLRVVSDAR